MTTARQGQRVRVRVSKEGMQSVLLVYKMRPSPAARNRANALSLPSAIHGVFGLNTNLHEHELAPASWTVYAATSPSARIAYATAASENAKKE